MTVGTLVHFVPPDGPEAVHGHCRPALVVAATDDLVDLVVFRHPTRDGTVGPVQWVGTVRLTPRHEFGTAHRPDACGGIARTLPSPDPRAEEAMS
jgi:hypothetical protein